MDLRIIVAFSALLVFGCNRTTQPEVVQSPLQRAVVLFATHEPEKALRECDQVLANEPNHYRALLLRGEICEALDDQDAARKSYTKALQLRPLDAEVRSHLKQLDDQANLLLAQQEGVMQQEGATEQDVESEAEAEDLAQQFERSDEKDQFAEEKAYRRLQDDDGSAESQPQQPTVSAADTHLRRLQLAIAEGRKRDLAAKRASRLSAQGQRLVWVAEPLDEEMQPSQVTRFDLGMGASVDPHVFQPHVATTGWRSPIEMPEDTEPPRRAFTSQSIPNGGYDVWQRLYDFPLDWAVLDSPSEHNPFVGICQDGIDNNGNGLIDASDPVCWLDGVNPGSYSPYLDEGREFLPPEYFVIPPDIVRN